MRLLRAIFILSFFIPSTLINAQNVLINGDFEIGEGGIATVPTFWENVSGSPDHCESIPTSCTGLPPVITAPSPQGGKWVRFFYANTNQGPNNEIFGQQLQTPLLQGQEYRLTLYIAHTAINPAFPATASASVRIGFSNGIPANNQVGAFDRQELLTQSIGTWIQRSVTFVASGNYNYISIGKTTLELSNACYVDDIVLEPTCAVSLGSNLTLCEGESFTLDATKPDATYLWQNGSTSPTFSGNTAGTYFVEVTTPDCISSDTVTVSYLPVINFNLNLGNDTTLCAGESLTLTANVPNATYVWQNNSINNSFTVTSSGQYLVTATVNQCSIKSDTINVSFISPSSVNLGNDTTLCDGDELILNVNTPGASYLWQDNSANSTFTVSSAGTYNVQVTLGNCSASDEIIIGYKPRPFVDFDDEVDLCIGDSFLLDASLPFGATHEWQDGSNEAFFLVFEAGSYNVKITAENGCIGEFSSTVNYNEPPVVNLGEDTIVSCKTIPVTLDAFVSNANYEWQDQSTTSSFEVNETGLYFVSVSIGSCAASDTVYVDLIDCDIKIEMPNVFSPNGDNINDLLLPKFFEGITSARIIIFNRWGKIIFESTNLPEGWNGESNSGEICPDGVYFYVLNYTDYLDKTAELKGTVTLIRNN